MRTLTAKTLFIIKAYIKTYLRYPANLFFKLVELPFQMFIYIFLWYFIFPDDAGNLSYMICYYLMTGLLSLAYPFIHIAGDIEQDVFEGAIMNCIVRPYNYIQPILGKYLAWTSLYSIVYIPSIIFVAFYHHCSAAQIIFFVVQSVIGLFVEFMMWYTIGLCALYTPKIRGVLRIIAAIKVILSGSLIPLTYMPQFVRTATDFLPFKYYIFVPVNTLLTEVSAKSILIDALSGLTWILIFILASSLIWNNALVRLEANNS